MTFFFRLLVLLFAPIIGGHVVMSQNASFNISALLDESKGVVYNGIKEDDEAGQSVSSGGDFNGDGLDDFVIGAPIRFGDNNTGQAYVVFGSSETAPSSNHYNLSTLNGTNGFILDGIEANDRAGFSVALGGDINGDFIDDLVIGAEGADPNGNSGAGQVYVVFGKAACTTNSGWTSPFHLSSLDGTNGFILNGIDDYDQAGISISLSGDVSGDGIKDLVIGANRARGANGNEEAGQVYIVFGSSNSKWPSPFNLSDLDGNRGVILNGIDSSDQAGRSVSSGGDANGDGIDDLVIGAPFAIGVNGTTRAGKVHVVYGSNSSWSSPFDLANLDGINGYTLSGVDENERAGESVSLDGDIDGDGINDIVIGASGTSSTPSPGKVYVVFGSQSHSTPNVNLTDLNGINGRVLIGMDAVGADNTGEAVASGGDLNRDGIDDLVIGARDANVNGQTDAGLVYVVFGSTNRTSMPSPFNLSGLDGINGFILKGIDTEGEAGRSVSSRGDTNGDNIPDIIIGAPEASSEGNGNPGKVYVVYGKGQTPTTPLAQNSCTLAPSSFPVSATDPSSMPTSTEACLELKCCQEDCCGNGTRWFVDACVKDLSSSGWNGTYELDHDPTICQLRLCCEGHCCGQDTQYDDTKEECVPLFEEE